MRSATAAPSSSALCASIGPRTTSPTAQMPGRLVRQSASATIKPRSSSCSPTTSAPRPSVLGLRPTETISRSTLSTCGSPLALVHSTVTPVFVALVAVIFAPRWIARPCLVNCLSASFATCASAAARKSGMASSRVTSAPRRRHTLPISSPITPAPITPRVLGTASMASAPSFDSTRCSSNSSPVRLRGTEPVARMICLPVRLCGSPSLPCTATCQPASKPPPARRAVPWKKVTLFFLNR
ncbi:hypothetical protein GALL_529050 [mine drainage metagenome]|uniref:Uncharacterized protein n=1 Tax=mine drainage metagenome TaxID=410659 RepID=A0A1J5PCI9_9ZZZZ